MRWTRICPIQRFCSSKELYLHANLISRRSGLQTFICMYKAPYFYIYMLHSHVVMFVGYAFHCTPISVRTSSNMLSTTTVSMFFLYQTCSMCQSHVRAITILLTAFWETRVVSQETTRFSMPCAALSFRVVSFRWDIHLRFFESCSHSYYHHSHWHLKF